MGFGNSSLRSKTKRDTFVLKRDEITASAAELMIFNGWTAEALRNCAIERVS